MRTVAASMYKRNVSVLGATAETREVDSRAASIAAKQQSERLVKQAASGGGFGRSSYGHFQSGFSRGRGRGRFAGRSFSSQRQSQQP